MSNKSLLWIINYLTKKDDIYLPDTISNYFIDSSNNITDISFYFHYVTSDVFKKESADMIKLYIKAKKIKNSFKKFFYLYKIKKANHVICTDLYLNPLNQFPDNQKVSILIENTIYDFRISNIINLWNGALTKNDGLFVKPKELKNPWTNIEFKKYNLYNLFFAILNSNFIMNSIILSFFKTNFEIDTFIYINFPLLKDIAINNFIKYSSTRELYDEIHNMLVEYEKDINYFYLPQSITPNRKIFYVKELSNILHYYCISKFSCNPLKKKCGYERCKTKLKTYFENSSNTAFYIRGINLNNYTNPSNIPLPIPNVIISSEELEPPLPPIESPPSPPIENDIDIPATAIIESPQDLELESMSSDEDSELNDFEYEHTLSNPFINTFSLPRTPPNQNNELQSNSSPFSISLFRRH